MGVSVGDMVVGVAQELAALHGDIVSLRGALNASSSGQPAPVLPTTTATPLITPPPAPGARPDAIDIAGAIMDIETAIERIHHNALDSSGGAFDRLGSALTKLKGGA